MGYKSDLDYRVFPGIQELGLYRKSHIVKKEKLTQKWLKTPPMFNFNTEGWTEWCSFWKASSHDLEPFVYAVAVLSSPHKYPSPMFLGIPNNSSYHHLVLGRMTFDCLCCPMWGDETLAYIYISQGCKTLVDVNRSIPHHLRDQLNMCSTAHFVLHLAWLYLHAQ